MLVKLEKAKSTAKTIASNDEMGGMFQSFVALIINIFISSFSFRTRQDQSYPEALQGTAWKAQAQQGLRRWRQCCGMTFFSLSLSSPLDCHSSHSAFFS